MQEFTLLQDLAVRHAHPLRLASHGRAVQHHTQLLRALLVSIQPLKIGHVVEEDYHSLLSELSDVVQRRDWFRLEELITEAEDIENKPIGSFDTSMHGRWCYNYAYIAAGLVVAAWWL